MKYCLTYIRGKCNDFVNEKSEIEFLLEDLSQMNTTKDIYKVISLPKYHCELAGEGIEYAWGLIKRRFCGLPLQNRNRVDTFRLSVKAAFRHVSTVIARRFSRQVRSHMLLYTEHKGSSLNRHCDMNWSETAFIENVWRESIGIKSKKMEERI